MNKVAEEKLEEVVKQSQLKNVYAIVFSTATILLATLGVGYKVIIEVKETIKKEVSAEIDRKFYERDKMQFATDAEQNYKLKEADDRLKRIESASNGWSK